MTRARHVDGRPPVPTLDALREAMVPEMESLRAAIVQGQANSVARAIRARVPARWAQWFVWDLTTTTQYTLTIPAGVVVRSIYLENLLTLALISVYLNGIREGAQPSYFDLPGTPGLGKFKLYAVNPNDNVVSIVLQIPALLPQPAPKSIRGLVTSEPWDVKTGSV